MMINLRNFKFHYMMINLGKREYSIIEIFHKLLSPLVFTTGRGDQLVWLLYVCDFIHCIAQGINIASILRQALAPSNLATTTWDHHLLLRYLPSDAHHAFRYDTSYTYGE
mgnify:CR=1 FL=1